MGTGGVGPALQRRSRSRLATTGMLRPIGPWPRVTRAHPRNGRGSAQAERRAGAAEPCAPSVWRKGGRAGGRRGRSSCACSRQSCRGYRAGVRCDAASLREADAVSVTSPSPWPMPSRSSVVQGRRMEQRCCHVAKHRGGAPGVWPSLGGGRGDGTEHRLPALSGGTPEVISHAECAEECVAAPHDLVARRWVTLAGHVSTHFRDEKGCRS